MKKRMILIGVLFYWIGWAQHFPEPKGWVNDFAEVISEEIETSMNQRIQEVQNKIGVELAVVTVPDMEGLSIEEYAVKLFEKWGIGKKKEDNGILLLLALNERKVRIEVGYGLEGLFPDHRCGEILDQYVVPFLREKKYGEGLYAGLYVISALLASDAGVKLDEDQPFPIQVPVHERGSLVPFIVFIFLLIMIARLRLFPLIFGRPHWGGWHWGGGGFGGGFGSGGFGGFGGGMSGGGGATRGF